MSQACLYIELDAEQGRRLSLSCDACAALMAIVSFVPVGPSVIYFLGDVPLCFLLFALCRAPASRTSMFLRSSLFTKLAPYSYAIYILHMPVIYLARFVRLYEVCLNSME